MSLPIEAHLIEPDPDNVRNGTGSLEGLQDLAESLRRNGMIQPIRVYLTDNGRYRIQAGHRRFAASQLLEWRLVPCEIGPAPADNLARLDLMLGENFHRESLNPMEEARAFKVYADEGLTQEEISRRVGRPQGHISTTLMFLTELTEHERIMLERGQMSRTVAVNTIKSRRAADGRARSDSGGAHRYGYAVPWFNGNHPRAKEAQRLCREQGHDPSHRLGPACGACWESTIRAAGGYRAAIRDDRGDLVDRALMLAELCELAGGPRETVMTATPERIRLLLDRTFARLMTSVQVQQDEDTRDRRTFAEAVADLAMFDDEEMPA